MLGLAGPGPEAVGTSTGPGAGGAGNCRDALAGPLVWVLAFRIKVSVVKTRQAPPFDTRAQFLLHLTDHRTISYPRQGERLAGFFGPAGSAYPVSVGSGGVGKSKLITWEIFGTSIP